MRAPVAGAHGSLGVCGPESGRCAAGARALAEARLWIGTPYRHQASLRGAGADCLGLFRGVWRALYGAEPEPVPPYGPDWAEPAGDEVLLRALARHLPRCEGPVRPGDLLVFRMRESGIAKHLGIVAEPGAEAASADAARGTAAASNGAGASFVHAYSGHGVVESPLSAPWARRIAARFAFP